MIMSYLIYSDKMSFMKGDVYHDTARDNKLTFAIKSIRNSPE